MIKLTELKKTYQTIFKRYEAKYQKHLIIISEGNRDPFAPVHDHFYVLIYRDEVLVCNSSEQNISFKSKEKAAEFAKEWIDNVMCGSRSK